MKFLGYFLRYFLRYFLGYFLGSGFLLSGLVSGFQFYFPPAEMNELCYFLDSGFSYAIQV